MTVIESVSFSCPTIAPKHYVVKGPSGWPETFDRKTLDIELGLFLGAEVTPRDMADLFVSARELSDKQEPVTWHTIVGFLGRSKGVSPLTIPPTVGIAFWAHIELFKRERATN